MLRARPDVDPARVVAPGVAYGSEAALLLASTFRQLVHGAIALVPSAAVTSGLPFGHAAWTVRGKPVPEGPIAVERIRGPVLSAGAGHDGSWDSSGAVEQIQRRLAAHRFAHQGFVYARAGHVVGAAVPYWPEPTDQPTRGGDPRADAAGKADLWPRILRFLAGPGSR
jgi:dienelactone hydrolase